MECISIKAGKKQPKNINKEKNRFFKTKTITNTRITHYNLKEYLELVDDTTLRVLFYVFLEFFYVN